jgi:hypothetical protein
MNRTQKVIIVIGMAAVILIGLFPVWTVIVDVRLDYEVKSEDSGKVKLHSESKILKTTSRRFLFGEDKRPESPYKPVDRRIYDNKAGYSTVTCAATEVENYSWSIDGMRLMLELLVAALPMLVLVVVFIDPESWQAKPAKSVEK